MDRNKSTSVNKLIGSPVVIAQICALVYMSIYGVIVTTKTFDNFYIQVFYGSGIVYTLIWALISMYKVLFTEPGNVTPALVEKLKK